MYIHIYTNANTYTHISKCNFPSLYNVIHMYMFSFGINYLVNDSFFRKTNLIILYNPQ